MLTPSLPLFSCIPNCVVNHFDLEVRVNAAVFVAEVFGSLLGMVWFWQPFRLVCMIMAHMCLFCAQW